MTVNGKEYESIELLGNGKSGYSYLVTDGKEKYVVKQIHHEPCSYYKFGNKLEAEVQAYQVLFHIGIRMPKLIDVDYEQERILKEYIQGDVVFDLVRLNKVGEKQLEQVQSMCRLLYRANKNIDYFPTNFVEKDGILFYIDYECNEYMEEWNFENWGQNYWSRTKEFLQYIKDHESEV